MGALTFVLTTVGAATALATDGAAVPVTDANEAVEAELVELTTCARPVPSPTTTSARTAGDTVVTLHVQAVTRLRIDDGRLVAATTNTGCAPRVTDVFVTADRPATAAEVAMALTGFRSGDWTSPGRWHLAR